MYCGNCVEEGNVEIGNNKSWSHKHRGEIFSQARWDLFVQRYLTPNKQQKQQKYRKT